MISKIWTLIKLGDPTHSAIVFLHGFMGLGKDWGKIALPLSDEFYCLFPDLPGHGDNPIDEQPSYATWVTALHYTLQAHDITRVNLVGYSMGGRLALYFALTYPELVDRLVLESANPGISELEERQARVAWDDENALRIQKEGLVSFLNDWYDMPLFASLKRISGLKDELCHQRAQQNPENMAKIIRLLSPGRQPDLWQRLPDLSPPTMLIAGLLDKKYTTISQLVAEMTPKSRLGLLPMCGHNAHREQPAQYVEILRNWLGEGK